MKKILLAGAVMLFGLSIAQIKTGTLYLSGQAGFSQNKDNNTDNKSQNFSAIPTVGVFIAPNLAVGTGIGYAGSKEDYKNIYYFGSTVSTLRSTVKTHAFVAAPFIRKYWTLTDNLYVFGQLEVPIEIGKKTSDLYADTIDLIYGYSYYENRYIEQKYTSFGVNIKPGLDYFINKNWTIEATIGEFGYGNMKIKDEEKGSDAFNFGFNMSSVTFGVKYVFAK